MEEDRGSESLRDGGDVKEEERKERIEQGGREVKSVTMERTEEEWGGRRSKACGEGATALLLLVREGGRAAETRVINLGGR